MLVSAALVPALVALTPVLYDSFGSRHVHRLDVPGWQLATRNADRVESGNIDGDNALDVCLLTSPDIDGPVHAVAFLDVREVIEPRVLSTSASDIVLVPESWSDGPGVVVATDSGLELFQANDLGGFAGVVLPGSTLFTGCTDLSVAVIGDDLAFVARNASDEVVHGEWAQGQFLSAQAVSYPGIRAVQAVRWQVGQLAYAVVLSDKVEVRDSVTGNLLEFQVIGSGDAVLRTQVGPAGFDRVVCATIDGSTTKVWVLADGYSPDLSIASAGARTPGDIDFADFDLDGHSDLILSTKSHPEAWVLYGGKWTDTHGFEFVYLDPDRPFLAILDQPVDGNQMSVGDVDGDTDPDLLWGQQISGLQLIVREHLTYQCNNLRVWVDSEAMNKITAVGQQFEVEFDWTGDFDLPDRTTALGSSVLGGATHILVEIYLQDDPDGYMGATPWFTDTIPIPSGTSTSGIYINEMVGPGQDDAVFLCRIQYVAGDETFGPSNCFAHSFDSAVMA